MAIDRKRRRLMMGGSAAAALSALAALTDSVQAKPAKRMPVIFVGHGSPMNAIQNNAFTRHLNMWGAALPRPVAILAVSAHWLTTGSTMVGVHAHPQTIHDFGGFPPALHQMQYPAPGAPHIAREAASLLRNGPTELTEQWGLDHGTWTVLHHLYPKADIPVFQLSIDYERDGRFHHAVGRDLAALRDKGVLIMGSGNIVHNLREMDRQQPESAVASRPWAQAFDSAVKQALEGRDDKRLINYATLDKSAAIAVPTPDHYFPFLYALGAADINEKARNVYETFQGGTLSMRCVQFG